MASESIAARNRRNGKTINKLGKRVWIKRRTDTGASRLMQFAMRCEGSNRAVFEKSSSGYEHTIVYFNFEAL